MNTTMEERCKNYTERWVNKYVEPRKSIDRVEGFVIVAAVFMTALAILSPRRRQSRSIIIRYGVGGVFILSFPLLSYTVGLMQAGKIKNELYPVWAMFLAMLFGGTSSMSVQKLDQNKQLMKLYCDCILFSMCTGTVLGGFIYTFGMKHSSSRLVPFIGCLFVVGYLLGIKTAEQWSAAWLASKPSSNNGIKWLALYMKGEHKLSASYDPRTMQGYKYPILIHAGGAKIGENAITLDNIWCDNIGILSSYYRAPIRRLKDLCLSFALFHLVVRRYFGYTCPESGLDKTRDLVLDGLLQTEQDYERAFQVIEAELAFLYDFFFTKYASIMYSNELRYYALSLTLTLVSIAAGAWSLSVLNRHGSILDSRFVQTSTQDVLVTLIALAALSVSQFLQIWSYCVSDWAKISFVCKYVAHPSWQGNTRIEKLLLCFGRPHKWLRYWRNTIGQYSVLDSFSSSYRHRLKHLLPTEEAGKPVELPMQVKRAVARTIKNSTNGHLSHGTSALMRHGMSDELCGACQINDEYTLTDSILAWHVATSFCEISDTIKRPHDVHPNQVVATILSKYCTYLVAFAPTLLPGSAPETKCALDEIVKEAKEMLHDLVSPREKYEKLSELEYVVGGGRKLFTYGAVLGKALESMDNHANRWDLLADFWAEMMVYIAPSNNVAGHIELLAEGGEFVTHVWALLMHAGILERPTTTIIP
ncbi:unnamed protein product [Triticum turgidum subsp. durum]|uniref:DUF4220 domain-containing protein n=1 Tax=Triticum turgidum subsp. durum TaxID=4567 RepID=A0A9R0RY40_TRITD|nr:unnamed protein product [Triticum turgidum subsp. durum]